MAACFSSGSLPCTKADWPACGYAFVSDAPFAVLGVLWLGYGLVHLRRSGSAGSFLHSNVDAIHDPVAQGIAIALAQRKSDSRRRVRLQRYVKLLGMWAEWPSYTYTPLAIGLQATGAHGLINPNLITFNDYSESLNVIVAVLSGSVLLLLRHWRRVQHEPFLRRFGYPLVFDLLYIPFISTCTRLATCPRGYVHLSLPGGATCDCLDRFGIFWAVGFAGFLLLYSSALHYKMYIEPTGTTMEFRFQRGFQVIMVMARTLNPILSMRANDSVFTQNHTITVLAMLAFLVGVLFLLVYSYRIQPCIGSGRIPNNIRVLSFASSLYTAPLPIVWLAAWNLNARRATHYHIPHLSILELLQMPSSQCKLVGTIAALHVDATKIAKFSRSGELLCRAYAIRVLWFCHIENFRKTKTCVGEMTPETAVPSKLWCKDRAITLRLTKAHSTKSSSALLDPTASSRKRVKIYRVSTITIPTPINDEPEEFSRHVVHDAHSVRKWPFKWWYRSSQHSFRVSNIKTAPTEAYHVVCIGDKHWISRVEEPAAAHFHCVSLYHMALEALAQSCAQSDERAMHEVASLLLEWYNARYLRVNGTILTHILSTLCATSDITLVTDATLTLLKVFGDGVLPYDLWLRNASYLNHFILVFKQPHPPTILRAATILKHVLALGEADEKTNLFQLLTPESIRLIHAALYGWHHDYAISSLLESICDSLYKIELHMHAHRLQEQLRRKASLAQTKRTRSVREFRSSGSSILSRRSHRSHRSVRHKSANLSMIRSSSRRSSLVTGASSYSQLPLPMPSHRSTGRFQSSAGASFKEPADAIQTTTTAHESNLASATSRGNSQPTVYNAVPVPRQAFLELQAVEAETADVVPFNTPENDEPLPPPKPLPKPMPDRTQRLATTPTQPLVFVTVELLSELDRRQSLRAQFQELLCEALEGYERAVQHPTTAQWLAAQLAQSPVAGSPQKRRQRHGDHDILDKFSRVLELYTFAENCAMKDFVTCGLDPRLRTFFEDHVVPFYAFVTTAWAKTPKSRWWPRMS
ncbi:hypothetical protein SPRG_08743 [Saprolegnia parasitica CBS 223.65]|uniref:Uncharacterized protein n=1 Tax=Saprolegnia parasitica (strain CBS 223.65) TaxID=695850 RepID=A0A067C9G5_SAPPC|nr:hypothetical protein SPRG_08743 [Saprolegnia parasitica CBS 223.65]KDO25800.1 hypothetical protein SPRG_08743 [Saprolegnia parasitica CBS 223.65]|eukprot:XP_012203365.1 hypothetical protein SPRG_08743 [Saprolegnia parasitica CBS 223.65]